MNLLRLFGTRDSSYSGKHTHRYVEKLLRKEKNLFIVSPYIDDYYAEYILRHSRGKSIRIISSAIKERAAKRLRGRDLKLAMVFAFLVAAINLTVFLMGVMLLGLTVLSSAAAIAFLFYSFQDRRNIALKVPKDFVHAKMYIGDSTAIEGSANLTYAGMHTNVEYIDIISDKERIGHLKKQFLSLWNSL